MNRKTMMITDIADLRTVSVDFLTETYGYTATKGNITTNVNSAPNIVYFGKGKFIGSFIFGQNGLRRIILDPIVPGVKEPNYPSEEYENIKKEYCVSILREIYGSEFASDSMGKYWKKGNVIIGCCVIPEGKAQNTGGNIYAVFRWPICPMTFSYVFGNSSYQDSTPDGTKQL